MYPRSDVERFRQWAISLAARRAKGLAAHGAVVIGPRAYDYGVARMGAAYLDNKGIHMGIFTSLDEAIRWLESNATAGRCCHSASTVALVPEVIVLTMDSFSSVPTWLLNQLFIKNGVFNQDRTAVVSGQDAPHTFSIDLTQRADWEAIKKTERGRNALS